MQTKFRGFIPLFLAAVAAFASTTNAETALQIPLPKLVMDRFGKLSLAEDKLVNAAAGGTSADCGELSGEDRIVRGDLLSWLCISPDASAQITCRGILIVGAAIVGKVDLQWAKIAFPVRALYCDFNEVIMLSQSDIAFLNLAGSSVTQLKADGAHFKGSVYLRGGFHAEGGVSLVAAKIDGSLVCDGGKFVGSNEVPALNADGIKIGDDLFLRDGFEAQGKVILYYGRVGQSFEWRRVVSPEHAILDLRQTKVGTLLNAEDWPTQGNLSVDGCVYEQIDSSALPNAEVQIRWLERQSRDRFLSQPFEQLAGVLRKMGLEEDARRVLIAKNEEHARYVQWRPEWLWYGLFGHLIGYGYSPWRAFGISLIVILIGWAAFRRGYCRGLVTPTGGTEYTMENGEAQPVSKDYPKFNAFVYSLETFVPLVKFGIADRWEPNGKRDAFFVEKSFLMTGGCLRGYMWFHMIAGWVLTALWVGGITGLVKT